MSGPVVLVLSHHGGVPAAFKPAVDGGLVTPVAEADLSPRALESASGLILTMHLDQVGFHARALLAPFLAGGGRCALNGHVMLPLLAGLAPFQPSGSGRLPDLRLSALEAHPLFNGVPRAAVQTRRGVAGFYARGHNPPPPGARLLTGIGAARAPADWVWTAAGGGALFSHAGNDLWTVADDAGVTARLVDNLLAWLRGAPR